MSLHCYLDDSKDRTQSEVYVSAGFVGLEDDWKALSVLWNESLARNQIEYFKSSECHGLSGQFARFRTDAYPRPKGREAANRIREELLGVARCFPTIRGVGLAIPVQTYRKVCERPEAKLFFETYPYQRALDGVFNETMRLVENSEGNHSVLFIHDEDPDRWKDLEAYYHQYKSQNRRHAERMLGFKPLDDKQHPPLQLADALANHSMSDGREWLANGQVAIPNDETFNLYNLGVWDERIMLGILKHNLKKRGESIPADLQSDEI